ncbi:MAG: hypothetical protein DMF40_01490 [Verrucomicrobia bacterium]|nr:MAG: hypothetical protein DMF40_01490 [Verrucomicrobiota bacterium]
MFMFGVVTLPEQGRENIASTGASLLRRAKARREPSVPAQSLDDFGPIDFCERSCVPWAAKILFSSCSKEISADNCSVILRFRNSRVRKG